MSHESADTTRRGEAASVNHQSKTSSIPKPLVHAEHKRPRPADSVNCNRLTRLRRPGIVETIYKICECRS